MIMKYVQGKLSVRKLLMGQFFSLETRVRSPGYNTANIFFCLIKYELNSLLSALHLVDYISVPNRFNFERYLLHGPDTMQFVKPLIKHK